MKFLAIISSLLLIFSSAYAKVSVTSNGKQTTYNVHIEGLQQKIIAEKKETFTRLSLKGIKGHEGVDYKVGAPEIPTVRFLVKADSRSDISIHWTSNKAMPKALQQRVYPAQPSQSKSVKEAAPFFINEASYKSSQKKIPDGKRYSIVPAGSIRGVPQQLVTLYPVEYNPTSGLVKLTNDFKITVNAPKSVEKSGIETFLFIVGEKFKDSEALAELMQSKRELGYHVVEHIVTHRDNDANKIRKAVQNVYNQAGLDLRYALIIGDSGDVTGQKAKFISGTTDHYYRAIDTDDYYNDLNGPDIGIGRLSAANSDQLAAMVHKILKYELGNFSDEQWLNHIAFLATNDRYEVAEGSHNYAIDNYTAPAGYVGVFPNNPQEGGDKLYAITHRVSNSKTVKTIKEGRFIVNYSGHGATTYWDAPGVKQRDVRSLDHSDATPFVISNACITGQFTIDESFAETWSRHPQGAIVYWGSMDSTYWDEDDILERAMYDSIFRDGNLHFDGFMNYAMKAVWKYYNGENRSSYYWETYHVFGDPSILLRTSATKNIVIDGNLSIPFGLNEANLVITDEQGTALPNVRVAIYANDGENEYISSAYSDETGAVSLNLQDAPTGTKFILTAVGNNTKEYKGELLVTSADTPYLLFKDVNVNGQKALHPYEEAFVQFNISNVGLRPTAGGTIEIVDIEGPAEVIEGSTLVPALGANESAYSNQLSFKVTNAAANDTITVSLKWQLNEGEGTIVKKTFTILRGALAITSVDFGDAANPTFNGINPGSTGDLFVTVTNNGTAPIQNARLTPASTDSCVAAIAGELVIKNLAIGESLRVATPFQATLAADCPVKQDVSFNVSGLYDDTVTALNVAASGTFLSGRILGGTVVYADRVAIPDNDNDGVVVEFSVDNQITKLSKMAIKLDITHPYRGDLVGYLVAPDGTTIEFLKGTGGSNDDVHETLISGTDFNIDALVNKPVNGQWKLVLKDKARGDEGTLDRFEVTFEGY